MKSYSYPFLDKTMKVKVKNEGKSAAFFKLSVKNQNQIYQFVLTKGQERRLKVTLNDKNSNVAMFYGPEITRKICKTLPHLEYTSKESSFLLGEDFRCYFDGEKPLRQVLKIIVDVSKFYIILKR